MTKMSQDDDFEENSDYTQYAEQQEFEEVLNTYTNAVAHRVRQGGRVSASGAEKKALREAEEVARQKVVKFYREARIRVAIRSVI